VIEDVRLRGGDHAQAFVLGVKIGGEYFDGDRRLRLADRLDRPREMLGATVLQVVTRHGRHHDVLELHRLTASATRSGSSTSSAKGFAVVTAQNPQARVQRSPAIMKVAVPALQHSSGSGIGLLAHGVQPQVGNQRLGGKENRLVGRRTLIQSGFFA